jgi:hypothetical protein
MLMLSLTIGVSQDENEDTGMKPVAPQVLWESMPENLDEWELLRSTGEMGLGTWLESRTIREYERTIPPAPDGQPQQEPAPPMWTRILVTDTGKHSELLAEFEGFSTEAPAEDERTEMLRIQTWPAFVTTYEDGLIVASLLVADRFRVEFVLKNQPKRSLLAWCRQIDFGVLTEIPDSEMIPLPSQVLIVKLDQLRPKRNKGYFMGTTSDAALEETLEAEEEVEEVMGYIPEIEDEGVLLEGGTPE